MRTRHKIFLIIISFSVFYFALIPVLQQCMEYDEDCFFVQQMVLLTRPSISVDVWDNQEIQEWSGSTDGIESSTIGDYLRINQNFILSMIVFPSGLIGAVVIWDKRK